jgi:hypothetical protein
LKVLDPLDMRALNEWEMTAQEKEDIHQVQERAGMVVEEDDTNTERVATTVAAVGEGQQRPLWIWFTGNSEEGTNDPMTQAGVFYLFSAMTSLLTGAVALHVEWAKAMA